MEILNMLALMSNYVFVPALTYGSQLALGALGITLVFGVLRFANFAHGDLMAFGTMGVVLITYWLQAHGIGIDPLPTALLALPFGIALAVGASLLIDRTVYRFYRKRRAAPVILVVASVGVMYVLNGLTRFVIGAEDQRFFDGARFLISAGDFKRLTGLEEGITIKLTQALTVVVAVLMVAALFWFLQKTRTGKAMRAYSDNEDLALLSGISPDRVVAVTWIIAAVLATVAGTLYGLDKSFKPFVYFQLILPMFAAAIVGGIGQPIGAIIGAYVVAFSEVMLTYAYKRALMYIGPEGWGPEGLMQILSTEYKFAISFLILVFVLLVRPTGIFRGKVI
ncbi:MAG: branched-chain amino acid ABC transporter permease [Rhodospirillaceae bacterium]|jgi:branched-chain amino acid transport system permease protein|uniref:branched-chain amino acid ABC transporter permease n=1 Tax=unclassified Hwanghaeella TaxID=2605944 RepID=UPI000C3D6EDC|nr:branched-chain amino acid ABC transporter permease [Rhodospirillales bacterium]MAX49098.1 branched-chain amino acid ABC transporter permease [Rhodospirillaceae bacterium]|tara:strand:+ start:48853 stop:49863 length:1011 start_codon:yes stop_codon:yes gene_type:complete